MNDYNLSIGNIEANRKIGANFKKARLEAIVEEFFEDAKFSHDGSL